MKIFSALFVCLFALVPFTTVLAQTNGTGAKKILRCATMEYYAAQKRLDPLLEQKAQLIAATKFKAWEKRQNIANRPVGTSAIIAIPIVFHVVGNATLQSYVTDQLLQRQVDVLNRDFGGLNPDTLKLPPEFRAVLAHSDLRFVLAKRTPAGTTTSGVERRVTNLTFTSDASSYNTQLKHTAAGGLDQWDGAKYYNVWITNLTDGILGIASFPNVNAQQDNEQGVAVHYGSIDQPCGSPFRDQYDGGRTLVHETGHFFYLMHIWGDDGSGCSGSDFSTPYGPLPNTCVDDTPNQAASSENCLSGVQLDACSPDSPGIMYQNYMDYTNDACYSMFTEGQLCRAEATLDIYRPGLKNSVGLLPVPGSEVLHDARVSEILYPTSRGYTCGLVSTICTAPFRPQMLIVNDGDAPLTSLGINIIVDGTSIGTQIWTGSLSPGDLVYVPINEVNSDAGTHVLTIRTFNPNGQPDGRPASDVGTANYIVSGAAVSVPFGPEGFESPVFPPPGWRVANENTGSISWIRTTTAASSGVASAVLNGFDYDKPDQQDYLVSPKLRTAGFDSLVISFDLAYAKNSDDPIDWEQLEVVYSADCGLTWQPTGYRKTGNALATNGGANLVTPFVPTAGQWRRDTVMLSLCGLPGEVSIGFRSTNAYGNNLYLDNISFGRKISPDPNVAPVAINTPNGLYCEGTIQPQVLLVNQGISTVTSVILTYAIDGGTKINYTWNGSLAACSAPVTVSLPQLTIPPGNHVFEIYTSLPNGTPDKVLNNDTVRSSFAVIPVVPGPVVEGFEDPRFPPINWSLQNFDNSITWNRTTEVAKTGFASMVIRHFNDGGSNTMDRFVSPRIVLGNVDSAFVSFEYAYRAGANSRNSLDSLELFITTDCGVNTTSIWQKGGTDLQTVDPGLFPLTVPFAPTLPAHWKSERIEITPNISSAPEFQIYFVSKGNSQNNLFIDNINIFGRTLPQRLKDQGYLIYPNPATAAFRIHHFVPPTNLRAAVLFNSTGQLVLDRRFNGTAPTEIEIPVTNLAAGVYILKMLYTDKTIVERIVKQ
ncbi:MAG: choice-of-anchor J domain-containing protein [Bacteroidota bacterium]